MVLMMDFFRKLQFHSILRFLIRCDPPTWSRVTSFTGSQFIVNHIYRIPPEGLLYAASMRPWVSSNSHVGV